MPAPTVLELCSISDIERYPGIKTLSAEDREWCALQIRGFSTMAEGRTRRLFLREQRTRVFDVRPGQRSIVLPAYGSNTGTAGTVDEVKESLDQNWGNANTTIAADSYTYDDESGMLSRRYGGAWLEGFQTVRVKWTAGLADATPNVPADLRLAAVTQIAFWYQRRLELGIKSKGIQGGSFTVQQPNELLPDVADTLARYERMGG